MLRPDLVQALRRRRPLLHCVSNQVSANDCANLALAVGASPMMAAAAEEMEEITALSDATVLNTGTPEGARFAACRICAAASARLGRPLVLDPVGLGASAWRLAEVGRLLEAGRPTILRVNLGEARALAHLAGREQGVDSVDRAGPAERLAAARTLARALGTTVLLTGEEDLVTDGHRAWRVRGGSSQMTRVTGTGCMLSVLCGAFAAVTEDSLAAAVTAAAFWKRCAALAEARSGALGPGSFRVALLDAAGTLTDLTGDVEEL